MWREPRTVSKYLANPLLSTAIGGIEKVYRRRLSTAVRDGTLCRWSASKTIQSFDCTVSFWRLYGACRIRVGLIAKRLFTVLIFWYARIKSADCPNPPLRSRLEDAQGK